MKGANLRLDSDAPKAARQARVMPNKKRLYNKIKGDSNNMFIQLFFFICLLALTTACDAKGIYSGYWRTYIPSEYGYGFSLSDDGLCKLDYRDSPGNEMTIQWETKNCRWLLDDNSLKISIAANKVEKIIKEKIYYGNTPTEELRTEYFDLNGMTIKYNIDKSYINKYFKKLYKKDYQITGITALVPERNMNCKEELCELPFFKVDDGINKSMRELIREGANSK